MWYFFGHRLLKTSLYIWTHRTVQNDICLSFQLLYTYCPCILPLEIHKTISNFYHPNFKGNKFLCITGKGRNKDRKKRPPIVGNQSDPRVTRNRSRHRIITETGTFEKGRPITYLHNQHFKIFLSTMWSKLISKTSKGNQTPRGTGNKNKNQPVLNDALGG